MRRSFRLSRVLVIGLITLSGGLAAMYGPRPAVAFPYSTYFWVWGANDFGELGDNANVESHQPLLSFAFPTGTLITALAAGDGVPPLSGSQSLARDRNQDVWAWGNNSSGQVGNGTAGAGANVYAPVRVCAAGQTAPCTQFLSSITAIAAGGFHSLGLKSDGTVWAWGYNGDGQLGTTGPASLVPVQACLQRQPIATDIAVAVTVDPCLLQPAATATAIAAGAFHSLALDSSGNVWAWGSNSFGQLGNGNYASSRLPSIIGFPQGTTLTAIAAGGFHSLALDGDGNVWTWGDNENGQLGNGSFASRSNVPAKLTFFPAGTRITAIAGGGLHSLALDSGGNVWAWGANEHGQLGNQTTIDSHGPARTIFPAGTGIVTIAAGGAHSLALDRRHNLWAWGGNWRGQLGTQTTLESHEPTRPIFPAGTRIVAIAAGTAHSLAAESRSFLDGLEAVLELEPLLAQLRVVPQSLTPDPTTLTSTSTALDRAGRRLLVTYTLTDTAGNTLVLRLIQRRDDIHSLTIRLQSLQYNGGAVMTLPANRLTYHWDKDARGTIKHFVQRLTLDQGDGKTEITAHYEAAKNRTKIEVELSESQKEQHLTEPGMVILQMSTVNGQLSFSDGARTWPQAGPLVGDRPEALDEKDPDARRRTLTR